SRGETVAVVEATAGGLVSAALLSLPGASRFYRGPGVVVYGLAGDANRQLLRAVLGDDSVFGLISDPGHKADADAYMAGKELWVQTVARHMRSRLGVDWCVAESGATGPTFNVPGVERAFTAVAVSGPGPDRCNVTSIQATDLDREANMHYFAAGALSHLADCIERGPVVGG
ncbi:unnamed protein product, partial [Prorocentrum cordatum]